MARNDEILSGLTDAYRAAQGPQRPVTAGNAMAMGVPPNPIRPQPAVRRPESGMGVTGPGAGRPRAGFVAGPLPPGQPPIQRGPGILRQPPPTGGINPQIPGRTPPPGEVFRRAPTVPGLPPGTPPIIGTVPTGPGGRPMVQGPQQNMQRPDVSAPGQVGPRINPALGSISTGPDGRPSVVLNEMGKQAYQRMRQDHLRRFGKWPGSDNPMSPQPNVIPGEPSFNPFSPDGWIES